MISGRFILSVIAISIGIIIACSTIREEGAQYNKAKIVPMHMVGMSQQGPWPSCVGMTGTECQQMIQAAAPDVQVQIVPEDSFMTMDFRTDRVRVMVNKSNIVTQTPGRG